MAYPAMHSVLFEHRIWDSDTRDGLPEGPVQELLASRTGGGENDACMQYGGAMGVVNPRVMIWVLSYVMIGFWEGLEDVSLDRG
jgi:hypothetical protein